MSLALESVRNALGLQVDDEAARIKVAEKIIACANSGLYRLLNALGYTCNP